MATIRKSRLRLAVALVLAPFTIFLASCSGSDDPTSGVPTPSAVPAGAVAVVGDTEITRKDYEASLEAGLSGYDPLSPTRVAPEPLDPPKFQRCIASITARARTDENLKGLGRATFLDSCRQRYDQLRTLTLSRLIQERWTRIEAELGGLEVGRGEADSFIGQLRLSWASRPAQSRRRFEKAVEASGLTPDELRRRAELAIARQQLAAREYDEGKTPTPEELQAAERRRFEEWREKTLCARALVVPECSNDPGPTAS